MDVKKKDNGMFEITEFVKQTKEVSEQEVREGLDKLIQDKNPIYEEHEMLRDQLKEKTMLLEEIDEKIEIISDALGIVEEFVEQQEEEDSEQESEETSENTEVLI